MTRTPKPARSAGLSVGALAARARVGERIRVRGKTGLRRRSERVRAEAEVARGDQFEVLTAAALAESREPASTGVVETGLGGGTMPRTSALTVQVLTNVAREHTEVLGRP